MNLLSVFSYIISIFYSLSIHVSISSVDTFLGTKKPKAQITPYELAKELQTMREEMTAKEGNMINNKNIRLNSDMVTQLPLIYKITTSKQFLHTRPEINKSHNTCVLDNGTRFYLKKRNCSHGNRGSNGNNLKTSNTDSRITEGNLLSKPMSELLKESDNINIQNLTRKKTSDLHNDRSKDNFDKTDYMMTITNDENNNFSFSEKKLWVEKHSPKSFSQLLSPEKINREVLKALKCWDDHVFRERKKEKKNNFLSNTMTSSLRVDVEMNSPKGGKKRKLTKREEEGEEGDGEGEEEENSEELNKMGSHKQVRISSIIYNFYNQVTRLKAHSVTPSLNVSCLHLHFSLFFLTLSIFHLSSLLMLKISFYFFGYISPLLRFHTCAYIRTHFHLNAFMQTTNIESRSKTTEQSDSLGRTTRYRQNNTGAYNRFTLWISSFRSECF